MSDESTITAPGRKEPEYLIVGQIVAPFGVKGELKCTIMTEFPDRFSRLDEITITPFEAIERGVAPGAALDPRTVPGVEGSGTPSSLVSPGQVRYRPPQEVTPFRIESTYIHKAQLILKLSGIENADQAAALRGYWLLIPRARARRLPKETFYLYQIVGLEVHTTEGKVIGRVADVITSSANDVYVVKGPGVRDVSGELLVPAIKQIVHSIEISEGKVVIAPPEEWM